MHETPDANTSGFVYRPHDAVTAVLPAGAADLARGALAAAAIETAGVEVLSGPEGRAILDGSGQGWRAGAFRFFQRLGSAGESLAMYEGALDRGGEVVAVPVGDRAEAQLVATALRDVGGASVLYFNGPALVESL